MFPVKRKKSAAVNKYMQLLQKMIGADADAVDLLKASLQSGIVRTIVKRPGYAEPLIKNPSDRFSSKLVSYDVYLR
jgi:16S rRNA (guanine1516-N2)-methyltransferase